MGLACDVGETRRLGVGQIEGPHQPRRHLGSSDRIIRAIAQRISTAAFRDAQLRELLDMRPVPVGAVDICETGRVNWHWIRAESPSKPHRQGRTAHGLVRAEPIFATERSLKEALLIEDADAGFVHTLRHV